MHDASPSWCCEASADAGGGCDYCGAYLPHAPETVRCIRCRAGSWSHGLSSLLSTRLAAASTLRAGVGAACACTTQAHHGAVRPLLMLVVAVTTVGHTHRMLLRRYGALAVVLAHGGTVCATTTSAAHASRLTTQAWWRHSSMCMHGEQASHGAVSLLLMLLPAEATVGHTHHMNLRRCGASTAVVCWLMATWPLEHVPHGCLTFAF